MNDLPTQGVLDLEVKDFGPIVKANIDLRPLMVLIGPSNTGKSYLASLIYALHRYFSSRGWPGRRRYSNKNQMYRGVSAKIWSEKTLNEIKELGLEIHADEGKSFGEEGIVLPDSVTDIIRSLYGEQSEYLGYEIDRCFGIEKTGALIRKEVRGSACISFRREYGKESAVIDQPTDDWCTKERFQDNHPRKCPITNWGCAGRSRGTGIYYPFYWKCYYRQIWKEGGRKYLS